MYTRWDSGAPDNSAGNKNCLEFNPDRTREVQQCEDRTEFICEWDAPRRAVPAVPVWGLGLLGALLSAFGIIRVRRRKTGA